MAQKVTGGMLVGDIVKRYPETMEVMTSYGLHCVGCHVSQFESLEDGCRGHGMTEEVCKELIAAINKAIAEADAQGNVINLTNNAAKKIRELMERQGSPNAAIRIEVITGVAAPAYSLGFDSDPAKSGDKAIEDKGVRLYYKASDEPAVNGIKIEYIETPGGSGFRIAPPQQKENVE